MKSLANFMVLTILFALIPLYTIVLYRNKNVLDNEEIRDKIGSLYIGMRVKQLPHYIYSVVFLVRRFFYVALIIALKKDFVLFS